MITTKEVDDFLEHFGKKGMQWGVRRQNRIDKINLKSDKLAARVEKLDRKSAKLTARAANPHANLKTGLKFAVGAASVVGIAAGAVYAKKTLGHVGNQPIKKVIDWQTASGPNWRVSGNHAAVVAFADSMMNLNYKQGLIM